MNSQSRHAVAGEAARNGEATLRRPALFDCAELTSSFYRKKPFRTGWSAEVPQNELEEAAHHWSYPIERGHRFRLIPARRMTTGEQKAYEQ